MAKLTKAQRRDLEYIYSSLNKTKKFILKEDVIIARTGNFTSAPEHTFINPSTGLKAGSFNKHIGSELCYLYNSIDRLKSLLEI